MKCIEEIIAQNLLQSDSIDEEKTLRAMTRNSKKIRQYFRHTQIRHIYKNMPKQEIKTTKFSVLKKFKTDRLFGQNLAMIFYK